MKIAVLADIHSNMDALDAVIEDANRQGADSFIVAGDLVSDGPSTAEVLQQVRNLTSHVIKGNREDYMLKYQRGEYPHWQGCKQVATPLWTYESLSADDLAYIGSLPEQIVLPLDDCTAIRMVHGSPFNMYELLKPYEDMAAVERSANAVSEQALVFGHNHMQWTGTVCGKLLMNPGTVGVHFNKEVKAEYGLLTYQDSRLSAELRQVQYDFAGLERKLISSGLMQASPVWTTITFEGVKAGQNYCLDFLSEAKATMQQRGISSGMIPNEIWDETAEKWWQERGWN
jgi:predicted phosphodiesterase